MDESTTSGSGADSQHWRPLDPEPGERFDHVLPTILARAGEPGKAYARIDTDVGSSNVFGGLHGGFLAAFAEQALFLPLYLHGRVSRGGVVTIDFALQYLTGGRVHGPFEARIEALRETGRLAFIRGELVQDDQVLVAFTGTLRKIRAAG